MQSAAEPYAIFITKLYTSTTCLKPGTFGQRQAVACTHTQTHTQATPAYPHLGAAIDLGCKVLWAMVAMATGSRASKAAKV